MFFNTLPVPLLECLRGTQELPPEDRNHLLFTNDVFLRDTRVRQAHERLAISGRDDNDAVQ